MSREHAVARGRFAAEAGMVDTCTIRRRTGESTGAGGVISPTWVTLYTGKVRMQIPGSSDSGGDSDVGEAHLLVERRQIQLPMSVTGLKDGDQLTVTAAARDADLVGRVYMLRDIPAKTDATARRITALEIQS